MESNKVLSAADPANISEILPNKEEVPSLDRHGHLIIRPGATIKDKYLIVKKLGKGYFGRVVQVIETKTNKTLAIKISGIKSRHRKAAKLEIETLRHISLGDPKNTSLCNKMINTFDFNGHLCITFDVLGGDIYHFMKGNDFMPFPLNDVRHIAYQLCYAVNFLHQRGIIHTDLKPDNILFVDSSYTKEYDAEKRRNIRSVNRTDIRLIDFGCAVYDETPHKFTISNRYYRAPEVIFQANWSYQVDVWSIACIIFELYTGNVLLNTDEDDFEHCGIMEKVLGAFPPAYVAHPKFFTNGQLNFDWSKRPLEENCHKRLRTSMKTDSDDDFLLIHLMERMLAYEPTKRITLVDALQHPFFDKLATHQRLSLF